MLEPENNLGDDPIIEGPPTPIFELEDEEENSASPTLSNQAPVLEIEDTTAATETTLEIDEHNTAAIEPEIELAPKQTITENTQSSETSPTDNVETAPAQQLILEDAKPTAQELSDELHREQANHFDLALVERIDRLLASFEKQQTKRHLPEQLPGKQFATGVHYIKHENNHYLGGKWLRKAAMQGHPKAQLYLGLMFIKGEGVPKSLFHAYCWLSLAACQDVNEAKDARKKLQSHLTAKEINASLKHAADLLEQIHSQ